MPYCETAKLPTMTLKNFETKLTEISPLFWPEPRTVSNLHRLYYESLLSDLEAEVAGMSEPPDLLKELEYGKEALRLVQDLKRKMMDNLTEIDVLIDIVKSQSGMGGDNNDRT